MIEKVLIFVLLSVVLLMVVLIPFIIKGMDFNKINSAKQVTIILFKRLYPLIFLSIVLLIIINYNSFLLGRKYKTLESAIASTKPKDTMLVIDNEKHKLFLEKGNDNSMFFVEYKEENNYWIIINDYYKRSAQTRYRINGEKIELALSVMYYKWDNQIIVNMVCKPFHSSDNVCKDLTIEDNLGNTFTFNEKLYEYMIIDNVSVQDYSYTFDETQYSL
ncbi:MAG: hypothetical protein IKP76_00095 [Bacilli bacterium]|nr:hypothetical protein [Bacilli bacterium]